jgi:hypothetical protein
LEDDAKKVTEERPNQWTPVTDQYSVDLDPAAAARLLDEEKIKRDLEARHRAERMSSPPLGIVAITWYYFLRAVTYLVFASMLLTDPLSSFSAWLYSHIQALVPLARSQIKVDTHNVFLGALVFTAILSVILGLLWMMRFAHARIITLGVLGITLALNITHLVTNQMAASTVLTTAGQRDDLILSSVVDAAIFCYLAISQNVAKALQNPF